MKKLLLVALMIAVAGLVFAGDKPCEKCPCKMEGVTKTVANLENGVKVTLSAKDPKVVAQIQEMMGKCEKGGCECPVMMKGVDRKTEKTADGMVMIATSADKEIVKKLQDHMTAEAKGHKCHKDCQHAGKDCPHHKKAS